MKRSTFVFVSSILLAGCSPREADPCDVMCDAAVEVYAGCLSEWGLDYSSVGYEGGEQDFLDACRTWAWEMYILEADAGVDGAVNAACVERADILAGGSCEDYTSIDWNTPPF